MAEFSKGLVRWLAFQRSAALCAKKPCPVNSIT
jgi:hypothetical protein